jgi:hypothetical protein
MGLIETIAESTTPPVAGILFFFEMSNRVLSLFFFFFLSIQKPKKTLIHREKKRGNRYRTDKYFMSLPSIKHFTMNVTLEFIHAYFY